MEEKLRMAQEGKIAAEQENALKVKDLQAKLKLIEE